MCPLGSYWVHNIFIFLTDGVSGASLEDINIFNHINLSLKFVCLDILDIEELFDILIYWSGWTELLELIPKNNPNDKEKIMVGASASIVYTYINLKNAYSQKEKIVATPSVSVVYTDVTIVNP